MSATKGKEHVLVIENNVPEEDIFDYYVEHPDCPEHTDHCDPGWCRGDDHTNHWYTYHDCDVAWEIDAIGLDTLEWNIPELAEYSEVRELPPGRYVVQMTHIHENNPIQGEYYDSEFYILRVDTSVSPSVAS